MRSFSVNELGLTVVHSVLPGVHAGATLKYVRGTLRSDVDDRGRGRLQTCSTAAKIWTVATPTTVRPRCRCDRRGGPGARRRRDAERARARVRRRRVHAAAAEPGWRGAGCCAKAGGPPLILAVDADVLDVRDGIRRSAGGGGRRRAVAGGQAVRGARRRPRQQGRRAGARGDGGRQRAARTVCMSRVYRATAARPLSAGGASVRRVTRLGTQSGRRDTPVSLELRASL